MVKVRTVQRMLVGQRGDAAYAKSIRGVSASRKVEIDFMNRLEVYRKRPRNWAKDKGIHVREQRRDKRPEYRSRLCGEELERWEPTMLGTFASMGPFECVMFLLSKALMWKPGQVVRRLGRSCSWMLRGHFVRLKRPWTLGKVCFLADGSEIFLLLSPFTPEDVHFLPIFWIFLSMFAFLGSAFRVDRPTFRASSFHHPPQFWCFLVSLWPRFEVVAHLSFLEAIL